MIRNQSEVGFLGPRMFKNQNQRKTPNMSVMIKRNLLCCLFALITAACETEESLPINSGAPVVTAQESYSVLVDSDITYANGLSHDGSSHATSEKNLELDVYYPDNESTNRPAYVFIHGGGFKGGTKTKPEIVAMAHYFASRGWVFMSIDYRTSSDLGSIYTGIAPQAWIDSIQTYATSEEDAQVGIAMYAAQRDAKASMRWVMANALNYGINTDFITVGGASAGAITTIGLGITDEEDFRDEISITEDPTLLSTNLSQRYNIRSIVNFWGSNIKLELFESVYAKSPYDGRDPELLTAHGTKDSNPVTTYGEAVELKGIYDSYGIYNELVTLNAGHGAWNATVNNKGLSELSFDFLVDRQQLKVE